MKNQIFKTVLAAVILMAAGLSAEAKGLKGKLPESMELLSGAYKGKSDVDGKGAWLLVYPNRENGAVNGTFNLYLLFDDRKSGQVFEGEVTGSSSGRGVMKRMAILPIGVDTSGEFVEAKVSRVGLLEMRENSKIGPHLQLRVSANDRGDGASFTFDRISDDVVINEKLPKGEFRAGWLSGEKAVYATITSGKTASIETKIPELKIDGVYHSIHELSGVMVLRPEVVNENSLNIYGREAVAGLLVSVLIDGKESVIVGRASKDGRPVNVQMLRAK